LTADLLLKGGDVVDVEQRTIRKNCPIAIKDGRVASVGEETEAEETIDLGGSLLTPGLIEPHFHISRIAISETARLQVAAGVTTTILETSEAAFPLGPRFVEEAVRQVRNLPGRIFITVPPMIGIDDTHERNLAPVEDWLRLLDDDRAVGVGEIYWADLLRGHERTNRLIAAAKQRSKAVEGHGAGARPHHLEAMHELGVGADHEATDAEQAAIRLRLGFWTYARDGLTRSDLEQIAPIWRDGADGLERMAFCTDGVGVGQLCEGRSLNATVAKAVAHGLPLPQAVRMATLVPARRFNLEGLGAIKPGAHADLVAWSDGFKPELVLVAGKRPQPRNERFPDWALDSVRVAPVPEEVFRHPGRGRWRAMRINAEQPMVTREVESDGSEALSAVAIDRLRQPRAFTGLIEGFGLRTASVATTAGSDSVSVVVIGNRPADMRRALDEVVARQGGVAVVRDGEVLARWSAPVAGGFSEASCNEVARDVAACDKAMQDDGCPLPYPVLTLEFLTSPAIPFLRISPDGYARLRDGARLGLDWD
jgi:adenine deaminase